MIKLSASLIKDFLSCPRKVQFRTSVGEPSKPTIEMLHGTIVHYAIEKAWDNKSKAFSVMNKECESNGIKPTKAMATCLDNFFLLFSGILSPDDEIEKMFKFPWKKDIYFQGKIDRIHNHVVYDWKTGYGEPEDLSRDPQFLIYSLAYRKMYKREPSSLMYVSLSEGRMYRYVPNSDYTNEFFNEIVPFIVKSMKDGSYPRLGMFGYRVCDKCIHKKVCLK